MTKILALRERAPQYGTLREIADSHVNPIVNHAIQLHASHPVSPTTCAWCGAPERLGLKACLYCGTPYREHFSK